MQIKKLQ